MSVLPVLAGTTVDFPNNDNLFHNVFSYSQPREFDLGRYPRGQQRSIRFDTPGAVRRRARPASAPSGAGSSSSYPGSYGIASSRARAGCRSVDEFRWRREEAPVRPPAWAGNEMGWEADFTPGTG